MRPLALAVPILVAACGGPARPPSASEEQIVLEARPPPAAVAPPARKEVSLGEMTIDTKVASASESSARDAEIRAQVGSWATGSRGCWIAEGGRFKVDFVVGIHGNVFDAHVEGEDTEAADCAKNRLIGWRFPEVPTSTHVSVTLVARGTYSVPSGRNFDRGGAAAALSAVDLRHCASPSGPAGSGHLTVTFEPGGSVSDVKVDQPPFAGTGVGACIERLFSVVRVSAFDGSPVKVGKTFVIP